MSIKEVDLQVGMMFIDKKQLKDAFKDYRIIKGYDLKIRHSDTSRFQAFCAIEGCEWTLWASKAQRDKSFQIRKISKPHSCVPYSFKRGRKKMCSDWLAHKYVETFRIQPSLGLRELRNLIERGHNYKPTLSMCGRTRAKSLSLILGNYKTQFGMIRAYANELLTKNKGSTVKIDVDRHPNGQCVFNSLYICLNSFKRGFLEGYRRVLSVDACFLKGLWNG